MQTLQTRIDTEQLVSESFERVRPELEALDPDELVPLNTDVKTVVATIIGSLPEIRALRSQIEQELPRFDLARFDKLEDYTWALSYAHTLHLVATKEPNDLAELMIQGTALRARLLADATSLSHHRLVDPKQLSKLHGVNGYRNVAQDLQILASVMQTSWANINGKSPTTALDLTTALRISARLLRSVGLRDQSPTEVAETAAQRVRAFTLVYRAYEDVRRAVQYLRAAEGDAEAIAGSLYVGRARKKADDTADEGSPLPQPPFADTTEVPAPSPAVVAKAPDLSARGPFMGA